MQASGSSEQDLLLFTTLLNMKMNVDKERDSECRDVEESRGRPPQSVALEGAGGVWPQRVPKEWAPHVHACMHARVHAHEPLSGHMHARMHARARAHAPLSAHMHARMHALAFSHAPLSAHMHACMHACMHVCVDMRL